LEGARTLFSEVAFKSTAARWDTLFVIAAETLPSISQSITRSKWETLIYGLRSDPVKKREKRV